MWPRRDLIDLLGIEHPILQAPMAGEATPALAAAVSNAGGLGGVGCSYMSEAELRACVDELRAASNQPFNLNFFAHPAPRADTDIDAATRALVAPFYAELAITEAPVSGREPSRPFDAARLATLLDIRPKVVSFHFGLPAPESVHALREAGCVVLCTATTVAEARALEAGGVDAIIAQGWEAGGHRGTFETMFEDFGVGTLALVPQVVDAVNVPVIAAGGIGDGRGIAAAFALGASGVQMGTAFLACPEANVSDSYRAAMREARDDGTRLTRAFSGRPARANNNRYIERMAETRRRLPDFPTMSGFSEPLKRSGHPEFQFLLWGQAAALNRELPAAELIARLVEETASLLPAA